MLCIVPFTEARNGLKTLLDQVVNDADCTVITRRDSQDAEVIARVLQQPDGNRAPVEIARQRSCGVRYYWDSDSCTQLQRSNADCQNTHPDPAVLTQPAMRSSAFFEGRQLPSAKIRAKTSPNAAFRCHRSCKTMLPGELWVLKR